MSAPLINAPLIRPPLFIISFRPKWESCGGSSRTRTCVLRRMRSCWSHLQSYCHIRFAWLTSLVLRDRNPLIPVLALGRVTIKTEKMVRGCDLMQIRLGAEGGTRTHTVSLPEDFESSASADSTTPAYGASDGDRTRIPGLEGRCPGRCATPAYGVQ